MSKPKKKKPKPKKIKPRIVRKAGGVYVLEFPPHLRTIKVQTRDKRRRTYHLSFPYVQFSRRYEEELAVTFSQKPLEDCDSLVTFPLLPNVDGCTSLVCLDNYFDYEELGKTWKCTGTFKDYIDYFWNSDFESGRAWSGESVLQWSTMKNFEGWERMTKEDPSFILTTNLGRAYPFKDLTTIVWGGAEAAIDEYSDKKLW